MNPILDLASDNGRSLVGLRRRLEKWMDDPVNARRLQQITDDAAVLYGTDLADHTCGVVHMVLRELKIDIPWEDVRASWRGPEERAPNPWAGVVDGLFCPAPGERPLPAQEPELPPDLVED